MDKVIQEPAKILTEEELRGIDVNNDTNTYEATVIDKLFASHRLLIQANAELSFKNQKYKDYLNSLRESFRLRDQYADVAEIDFILEELK